MSGAGIIMAIMTLHRIAILRGLTAEHAIYIAAGVGMISGKICAAPTGLQDRQI